MPSLSFCTAMNTPISEFPNFQARVPNGDTLERHVCSECKWIHYENPRIIVTGLCVWENQVLFCRRAIPPRYGFWTLPGGFLEVGETMEEGTQREVFEEAGARIEVESLLGTYSIARIGQVHMVYLARMTSAEFAAGAESLDVKLFPIGQLSFPWAELAFPVNCWTLRDFLSLKGEPVLQPFRIRKQDSQDRMSPIAYHPDFPPPGS